MSYFHRVQTFRSLLRHFATTQALVMALGIGMATGGWIALFKSASYSTPHRFSSELTAPQADRRQSVLLTKLWLAFLAAGLILPSYWVIRRSNEVGAWVSNQRRVLNWAISQYSEVLAKAPSGDAFQVEVETPITAADINLSILLNATMLIVWGTQGSGKTTFAKAIAELRQKQGHSIEILDPHGSKAEWGDWKVIGSGRDYDAIEAALKAFDEAVTQDYQAYSEGRRDFAFSTVLCDEFTQWADNCESSPKFVKSACSDLRKIKRCVILISHTDTLTGLGDAKGMKAALDRSAIKLQLESEIGADGQYYPTGYGWLQLPGREPQRVKTPRLFDSKSSSALPQTRSPKAIAPTLNSLEKALEAPKLSEELQLIIQAAKENNGRISVRECQRYKGLKNKVSAEQIKALFYQLQELEIGRVQTDNRRGDRLIFWLFSDA